MYFQPKIYYTGIVSGNITLKVKWFTPDGVLSTGNSSPSGFSQSHEYYFSGDDNKKILRSWGGKDKGHWKAGTYRIEIWYKDVCLKTKTFTIYWNYKQLRPTQNREYKMGLFDFFNREKNEKTIPMKIIILFLLLSATFSTFAQTPDTIQTPPDYLDFDRVKIEVALQQYDSVMYGDLKEYPFGIVFQDGKGGVYDFRNAELVTEIIYENLNYAGPQEGENDTYHIFRWENDEEYGLISVSESDGGVMGISYKKEEVKKEKQWYFKTRHRTAITREHADSNQ